MKKFIFCIFLLSVLSEICFSQSKKFEGYDNMAWGTTLEEFNEGNDKTMFEIKDYEKQQRMKNWEL